MSKPDSTLPLKPAAEPVRATPAPAWLALICAWLGLIMLIASIVFLILPGSRDPVAELEGRAQSSVADRFLPIPIYGITFTLFLGIVVLWQMRHVARPLPDALVAQRVQAWVAIILSLIATTIIYVYVGIYGPK